MVISAKSGLNGKLKLIVLPTNGDPQVTIYLMPNSFSDNYGTQGILENGHIYTDVQPGLKIEVPADWSIYIMYKHHDYIESGSVRFQSYV